MYVMVLVVCENLRNILIDATRGRLCEQTNEAIEYMYVAFFSLYHGIVLNYNCIVAQRGFPMTLV